MMSYWTKQEEQLWDEWIELIGQPSGDAGDFIEWAMASRKLALRPQDMKQLRRKQVTQALRQVRRYDEEGGFTYRAKQSVTLLEGDVATKHYFDTDKGGTANLRQKSAHQRREAVAHDVYRAVCDVERMNKIFSDEPRLSFLSNFTDDVEELRAAEWLDRERDDDD
jgi:hypothetical protein